MKNQQEQSYKHMAENLREHKPTPESKPTATPIKYTALPWHVANREHRRAQGRGVWELADDDGTHVADVQSEELADQICTAINHRSRGALVEALRGIVVHLECARVAYGGSENVDRAIKKANAAIALAGEE